MKLKVFFSFFLVAIFLLMSPKVANGIYDPSIVSNNSFGIHISDEHDLEDAARLVNSGGGSWGYVTIVIRDDDRHQSKWQKIFNKMRQLEIIPIVRIATHQEGSGWAKPTLESAKDWASFLHSLNWVIENRYVVLFNEPNHAKEWGGDVSPSEYADIVKAFSSELKKYSPDFFVISAGFDSSAPNGRQTMDSFLYFERMYQHNEEVFTLFDGWASHSYPNPGFMGDPSDTGKKSILGYKSETEYLKGLGLKESIPIFITETGWIHKLQDSDSEGIEHQKVGEYLVQAFNSAWNTSRVIAVTPFIFNYPNPPFDRFSWKKADGSFYPQYEKLQELKKKKGAPRQKSDIVFLNDAIPSKLIADSHYRIEVKVKNTGQTIWYENAIKARLLSSFKADKISWEEIGYLEPNEEGVFAINLDTSDAEEEYFISLQFQLYEKELGEKIERKITVVPPTSLVVTAPLALKAIPHSAENISIIIYEDLRLIKKIDNLTFVDGVARVKELHDVIPGKNYRFVILKPYYLPSQTTAYMSEEETVVTFEKLLPIDLNKDGAFSWKDIFAGFIDPFLFIRLFFPFS